MTTDPYARMSDSAPPPAPWVIYVHETEHRIVEGASQWTLSDTAKSERLKDWRTFQYILEAHSKGAAKSSALKEEVLICARRALYAAGGGTIVVLDRDKNEVESELVAGCVHAVLNYDYMGGDICADCGAHF